MKLTFGKTALTLCALQLAFVGQTAQAETLKASLGVGTKHSTYLAYQSFADFIAENSDLKVKVYSMSLLSLKETPAGIRDGLADLGFVTTGYFPAEYSETNLAANLSMFSTTGRRVDVPGAAMAGAMTEYVLGCPDCLAEFQDQGQVYLGSVSSAPYNLLCTRPIADVADLKGAKVRSSGGNYTRWAEHFGAISVTLPAQDQYEGLSQGVIDCTMAPASDLTNQALAEVAEYTTLNVPGGVFSGTGTSNFNTGVWQGLTTEQRAVMLRGAARMQAEMTLGLHRVSAVNVTGADDIGVTLVEPTEDLLAATDAFVQADRAVIEQQFTEFYGVENATAKIAEVSALVEKWKDLTADIADDQDALTQVYWEELFSRMDPASYGLAQN
ncbi:C4-dicarboxylate TRAP transporter substrate-binding protein [Pseudooceanicola aestuarii]|uniref:C4-dicarboxylate TRAP transporter substrate-binding protein n=1 Tax=Pseudooceanicola aestuarii TaxID=2697319 RepID=UPI0013D024FA|nr:C4-dicarboxylate TRAP transporter substrate-binding protein [Pseudooceanicola aestuarii]